jgi:hypothetical protein
VQARTLLRRYAAPWRRRSRVGYGTMWHGEVLWGVETLDSFDCCRRNSVAARPRGSRCRSRRPGGGLYDRNWVGCWKCVLECVIERLFLVLPRRTLGATAISSMRFTTAFGSVFHLYPDVNWL